MNTILQRVTISGPDDQERLDDFASDVRAGLGISPKRLPSRHLYDRTGSLLFEAICSLPEYYLTRKERAILEACADEIAARCPHGTALVELGAGSGEKTRILIEAFLRRRKKLNYVPIDVSAEFLEQQAAALAESYSNLEILAFAGEYRDGLRFAQNELQDPACILWLGSSIGNLERSEAASFFEVVSECMDEDDHFLVGIDLRKERAILERAYNDSRGVSAHFNQNILVRINRELGGQFDLTTFRYLARYDDTPGRVVMGQVSKIVQKVVIDDLDLEIDFDADEPIHIESSHKYSLSEIEELAEGGKVRLDKQWFDPQRYFSVNLFARQ